MDICIINEGFLIGGVERVTVEIGNSLESCGNKVTLIDFTGENKYFYKVNENITIKKIIKPRTLKRRLIRKATNIKHRIDKKEINIKNIYADQLRDLIYYLKGSNHDVLILCQGMLTALILEIKKKVPTYMSSV